MISLPEFSISSPVVRQSAQNSKNGRLANLVSNPLVCIPIFELWAKMG